MSKPNVDLLSLFDDIIQEGMSDVYSRLDPSIVDFATQKLFNGKDLLYPTQKAILKMYNRETLNDYEKKLVGEWKDEDRTTYKEGRVYQHIVIEGGRRMSKSMLLAVVCLYELDRLISLPDPASHYGLLPGSPIALFVISQSLQQVKDTLFAGIRGFAEQSIYFKALEKSKKIEILQTEIRCRSKNVGLYAGHTNSKALVGYSIKLLILDEVARFDIDEFGNSKADHIWDNVGRAVNTFGKEGRKIAISSAWEPNDKIQQLWNMCKKDTTMLGFRFRTWDVNLHPEFTEAKLKSSSDYIQDPLTAALEYEGIRIDKQGSYFTQESILQVTNGESCLDVRQIPIDRSSAGSTRYYAGVEIDLIEKIDPALCSFAHIDYGVKKDMSAFSVCKPHFFDDKGQWGIKVDGIITWRPYTDDKGKKRIVDFINCEEIMEGVCEARNVRKLSFDSFQCLKLDSWVSTPLGLRKVQNLKVGDLVEGENSLNSVVCTNVKHNAPSITIKTKFGYTLTGTPNHPIRTVDGSWTELKNLKLEDKVKLASNTLIDFDTKEPKSHSEYRALICGYMAAEGSWKTYIKPKTNQTLRFHNTENDTKEDFANHFYNWCGVTPNIYPKVVSSAKAQALDLWNSYNLDSGSWNKKVPDFIVEGSNAEIGYFLSGAFEGDGHCYINKKNGYSSVGYTSVSKDLIEGIQLLLLKLNIKSTFKHYYYTQKDLAPINRYQLYVNGQNLINFQKYVGFRSARKIAKLSLAVESVSKPQRKNRALYMEDIIVSIEKGFDSIVQMEVSGDHSYKAQGFINHNSVASIQRLHTQGIETIEMSTSQSSQIGYYSLFRKLVDQGLMILPMEGYTSVQMQQGFACIIQLPNGKITHQIGYKDIPDSIVNCVWNCNQYMTMSGMTTGTVTNMSRVMNERSARLTSNKAVNLQNSRNALQKLRSRAIK